MLKLGIAIVKKANRCRNGADEYGNRHNHRCDPGIQGMGMDAERVLLGHAFDGSFTAVVDVA